MENSEKQSLFPAYTEKAGNENQEDCQESSKKEKDRSVWLENSSYQELSKHLAIANETRSGISDSEFDNLGGPAVPEVVTNAKKNVGTSKRHKKQSVGYETSVENLYFEKRERDGRLLTMETIECCVIPKYERSKFYLLTNWKKDKKTNRFLRYYQTNLNVTQVESNRRENTDENVEEIDTKKLKLEEARKKQTEDYNKKLARDPRDINTWLEYVSFQDTIAETMPFSSNKEKSNNLLNQKKLSIVEEALLRNRDSVELLKMKLLLMSKILPGDIFSNQLEVMLKKDSKNMILWEALIMITQRSMAIGKVSKVLNLYSKSFVILKQKSKANPKIYDAQILDLLHQCLSFLRHAGLWEQMWEILRLNLCLNLGLHPESMKDVKAIDEKYLMDLEEIILKSELPLNQLWLRVESLRESCHWIAVDLSAENVHLIADDKRLVSREEVADFLYPLLLKESNFRAVVLLITSLKVPLLPTRHCTLSDFKLNEHCWVIDSLEFILPMIYPTIRIGVTDNFLGNKTVINNLVEGNLTSGPQILKFHPASEHYVDFLRIVFKTVAEKLTGVQRTSILVWWLRFERLLIFINKQDPSCDKNRDKKVKSVMKEFFKQTENISNLYFYQELAAIEFELGNLDKCVKILKQVTDQHSITSSEDIPALISLYRSAFEIILNPNCNSNLNPNLFQEFVNSLEKNFSTLYKSSFNIAIEEKLYNEILKLFSITTVNESENNFMLPNIYCDMLLCYSYIVQNKSEGAENLRDTLDLFDKCLNHCIDSPHLQERFFEAKITFLQMYEHRFKELNIKLMEVVKKALDNFPNNFFFLSINASHESKLPLWKSGLKKKTYSIWSAFADCLAGRARITDLKSKNIEDGYVAAINKMLAIHKKMSNEPKIQDCPLLWRFYMLLLQEHTQHQAMGETIYYKAVEHCPLVKNIYISAAEIAPQILPQIHDLIKEKEIRMRVTPEELNILRG